MALSMVLESAEVLEHFQWKSPEEVNTYAQENKADIAEEIADVLKYLVQLADNIGVEDIVQVALDKLQRDAAKYPVDKAKGKHTKYTKL
jgi:NTP pyrophosphatase (non-canonical NTP hydrolase)